MSESFAGVEPLLAEHAEIESAARRPRRARGPGRARTLGRRYAELGQVVGRLPHLGAARTTTPRPPPSWPVEDASFAAELPSLEEAAAATRPRRLRRVLVPRDPDDGRDVILEIKAGEGGEESALFAGDLLRMYLRYAERRGWTTRAPRRHRVRPRRVQGRRRSRSRRAARPGPEDGVWAQPEVRGRRAPRAAGAGHRVAGPHPHLGGRRAGVPRGRRRRRGRDRPERPAHRRLPVLRPGRAVRQHDRLRGAHHAPAHRHRRVDAEREVAAAEPRAGDARAARPAPGGAGQEAAAAEAAELRRSQVRTVDRSERIRTYNFPENRIADHRTGYKAYNLDAVLDGDLDPVVAVGDRRRRGGAARGGRAVREVRVRATPVDAAVLPGGSAAGLGSGRRRATPLRVGADGAGRRRRAVAPARRRAAGARRSGWTAPSARRSCSAAGARRAADASPGSSRGAGARAAAAPDRRRRVPAPGARRWAPGSSCPGRRPRWWRRSPSTRRPGHRRPGGRERRRRRPVHRVRARSRWPSRPRCPARGCTPSSWTRPRTPGPARNLGRASAVRRCTAATPAPRSSDLDGTVDVVVVEPAVRAAGRRARRPRGRRARPGRRAVRAGAGRARGAARRRRRRGAPAAARRAARHGARRGPGRGGPGDGRGARDADGRRFRSPRPARTSPAGPAWSSRAVWDRAQRRVRAMRARHSPGAERRSLGTKASPGARIVKDWPRECACSPCSTPPTRSLGPRDRRGSERRLPRRPRRPAHRHRLRHRRRRVHAARRRSRCSPPRAAGGRCRRPCWCGTSRPSTAWPPTCPTTPARSSRRSGPAGSPSSCARSRRCVGPGRDPRHRRPAHARPPRRARPAAPHRPARRLQRQPDGQPGRAGPRRTPKASSATRCAVYLDGGPRPGGVASTIVDATGRDPAGRPRGRGHARGAARGGRRRRPPGGARGRPERAPDGAPEDDE